MKKNLLAENMLRFGTKNLSESAINNIEEQAMVTGDQNTGKFQASFKSMPSKKKPGKYHVELLVKADPKTIRRRAQTDKEKQGLNFFQKLFKKYEYPVKFSKKTKDNIGYYNEWFLPNRNYSEYKLFSNDRQFYTKEQAEFVATKLSEGQRSIIGARKYDPEEGKHVSKFTLIPPPADPRKDSAYPKDVEDIATDPTLDTNK